MSVYSNSLISIQRRNIEILKIRFGEAALQVCEVMLKDMTDSKRIDGHVQSQRAVSPLFRPCPGFNMINSSFFAVDCPSNNYIATFLAFIRDKRDDHAWTISAVRTQLFFFPPGFFNGLNTLSSDCKQTMLTSLLYLNRIRN